MTAAPESVYPASVDHTEFRTTLARLGLRQVDFARLVAHLSGEKPNSVTVNRWAVGTCSVPPTVAAILRLWEMLPTARRKQILKTASEATR
jgi:hypothetical protein